MTSTTSVQPTRTHGPGGPEWVLQGFGYQASVTAVGASLRTLTYDGRNLVVPFDADRIRPLYRGATIAPWPNRIRDGRYRFEDVPYQVPINEVDRGNALHGLVHWARWEVSDSSATVLTLTHHLVPQDGYPFSLALAQRFELSDSGLTTTLTATNTGDCTAPYGCCPHPYLVAGPGQVDDWLLTSPARQRLDVDNRLLPLSTADVEAVDSDFRSPGLIGTRVIDHAFTDLDRDAHGVATVTLTTRDQTTGVQLSWGPWAPWRQIHTADRPEPEHHRIGLAVEPMSCAPDAFNTGNHDRLLPDAAHRAEWTIRAQ